MRDSEIRAILSSCYHEAISSPDQSTQLAAMVQGFYQTLSHNGPVKGWNMTEQDWDRPRKYALVEHAERRAIYKAAQLGIPTKGKTLVATWAACADCARAIVEAGFSTLIRHYPPQDDATMRWLESVQLGDEILVKGGVTIIDVVGDIPGAPPILRGGELFFPSGKVPVA